MVFFKLPKFKKTASELQDNTDMWLSLLKNTFSLKACPQEITGEIFKLFLEIAEKKQVTPDDLDRYAVSLERSYQMREIANFAREEAREEARAEAIIEKAEAIMEKSNQFAIKLLMMNEPIDKVMYLTELSREQINKLLSQLPKS
jgi:predicted transposase/invertase (TIGR01784 family)